MWKRTALAAAGIVIGVGMIGPKWRDECAAQLVHGTGVGDKVLASTTRAFERTRAMVALGILSDDAVDRLAELRYRSYAWYGPSQDASWPELFPWEEAFLDRYLPKEASCVLIGGAGAGREAFHVASRGHEVVAFDPIPEFVEIMVRQMPAHLSVRAFHGRYEDLPHLNRAGVGHDGVDLTSMPPFAGAILGWCSFSHILKEEACIDALRRVAGYVSGPILISFYSRNPDDETSGAWTDRIQRRLPGRNSDPTWDFRMFAGVFRAYTAAEMLDLCTRAGLSVVEARVHPRFSPQSYVIVQGQGALDA
jgi:SAM-dependent methyltransferase